MRERRIVLFTFFCFAAASVFFAVAAWTRAEEPPGSASGGPNVQDQIKAKAEELDRINQELLTTQKNLSATKAERAGLQKELGVIDQNIIQLNLRIKADNITIEKVGLEMQALQGDLQDIRVWVKDKKAAIGEIVRTIQRSEQKSVLVVLLKSGSLADGVSELQNLRGLNTKLASDITALEDLHREYSQKVDSLGNKKEEIEVHKKNSENRKEIVQDQKQERQTLIVQTKNKESVYEQQVAELKKRQQEVASEIERIEAELRKTIDPNLLPLARPGVLAWPVKGGRLTQGYGNTSF
ncbi:MAG: hypothetical protein AAB967_00305, partial [Patescibacteria group bacterium]